MCLAKPECRFPVFREDASNGFLEQLFYFSVQVDERSVQLSRESPAYRRLSHAREADQDEVTRRPRG